MLSAGWKKKALALFLVIFVLDTWTKLWAQSALLDAAIYVGSWAGIDLFLSLTTNQGAAWGIGSALPGLLLVIRIIIVTGLIVFLFSKKCPELWHLPLSVALSGAVCNIRDTLVWGHVIDMVDVRLWGYDYPVFNVADTAITLAVIVLIWRCRLVGTHTE